MRTEDERGGTRWALQIAARLSLVASLCCAIGGCARPDGYAQPVAAETVYAAPAATQLEPRPPAASSGVEHSERWADDSTQPAAGKLPEHYRGLFVPGRSFVFVHTIARSSSRGGLSIGEPGAQSLVTCSTHRTGPVGGMDAIELTCEGAPTSAFFAGFYVAGPDGLWHVEHLPRSIAHLEDLMARGLVAELPLVSSRLTYGEQVVRTGSVETIRSWTRDGRDGWCADISTRGYEDLAYCFSAAGDILSARREASEVSGDRVIDRFEHWSRED